MPARSLQFGLRGLLAATMLVATATFGFVRFPPFALFVISAAGGILGGSLLAQRYNARSIRPKSFLLALGQANICLAGAAFGGGLGGFSWTIAQIATAFAVTSHLEFSIPRFIDLTILLSPDSMAIGALIGGCWWLALRGWQMGLKWLAWNAAKQRRFDKV